MSPARGAFLAAAVAALAGCAGSARAPAALTPEEEHLLRPVPDAPEPVERLIEEGDRLFRDGVAPYRASDPAAGSGAASAIPEALDLYRRARLSYVTAQSRYSGLQPVPPALMERIRECVMRIATLERRRHAVQ